MTGEATRTKDAQGPDKRPIPTTSSHSSAPDPAQAMKLSDVMRSKIAREAAESSKSPQSAQLVLNSMLDLDGGDDSTGPDLAIEKFDFQDIRTDLPHIRQLDRGAPIESSRAIGEQITDAVQKLLAEQSDGPDLVRFRTDDGQQFTALIRHDGRGLELRLMADDSATRNLLGDRLPEVRQALERAGLSAQVSVDRDPSRGSARRPFELPEDPPPAAPTLRRHDPVVETSGLHLIL